MDELELDDFGVPQEAQDPSPCSDCGAPWEHSAIDDTMRMWHYPTCYLMHGNEKAA